MQASVAAQASLLGMPPETLANIYDWLRLIERQDAEEREQAGELYRPPTWAPISKDLLPYTQTYFHSIVRVWSSVQLVRLAATICAPPAPAHKLQLPDFGRAIRELTINCGSDASPPGLGAALEGMWPRLNGLTALTLDHCEEVLDSLVAAVGRGQRLPKLRSLEVTLRARPGENPYDLGRWRALVAAAPLLVTLGIRDSTYPTDDSLAPEAEPEAVPGSPFATKVTSLKIDCFPAPHAAAVASFVNAFPGLIDLVLEPCTDTVHPRVVEQLSVPTLRRLQYEWATNYPDEAEPLASLDLVHLPALEEVWFGMARCAPAFHFLLPSRVRRLQIGKHNSVPLAALTRLVTPDTADTRPALEEIHLDLPYAWEYQGQLEALTAFQMLWIPMNPIEDAMRWTDEVSPQELIALRRAAAQSGVKVTGNCLAVFTFEETMRDRVDDGEFGGEHDDEFEGDDGEW